jgi:hypothetical protein
MRETLRAPRHRLADQPAAADEADGLARARSTRAGAATGRREISGAHEPVALHHAARHDSIRPKVEIGVASVVTGGTTVTGMRRRCFGDVDV